MCEMRMYELECLRRRMEDEMVAAQQAAEVLSGSLMSPMSPASVKSAGSQVQISWVFSSSPSVWCRGPAGDHTRKTSSRASPASLSPGSQTRKLSSSKSEKILHNTSFYRIFLFRTFTCQICSKIRRKDPNWKWLYPRWFRKIHWKNTIEFLERKVLTGNLSQFAISFFHWNCF